MSMSEEYVVTSNQLTITHTVHIVVANEDKKAQLTQREARDSLGI